MSELNPTPGPYNQGPYYRHDIHSQHGGLVATTHATPQGERDAAFIVEACNSLAAERERRAEAERTLADALANPAGHTIDNCTTWRAMGEMQKELNGLRQWFGAVVLTVGEVRVPLTRMLDAQHIEVTETDDLASGARIYSARLVAALTLPYSPTYWPPNATATEEK